jgi:hypothetical protein
MRLVPIAAAMVAALMLFLGGTASGYGPAPAGTWVVSGGTVGGGVVASVVTSGSTAYLGGNFGYVGPQTGSFVPVDPASGDLVAPWPVVGGDVYAAIGDGFGGFYIGGSFTSVGAAHIENVAHVFFDGTLDTEWEAGTDGPVYALARSGAGGGVTLYLGGAFTTVNGESRVGLAAIDVNGALVPEFDPAVTGGSETVLALEVRGSTLYVGGSFDGVGGGSSANLGAVDASGTATSWSPDVNAPVFTIAVAPDGSRVYAGGVFSQVNSPQVARSNIAAFDGTTGAVVADWNPGADGEVDVIRLSSSGNTVWIGGAFSHLGTDERNGVGSVFSDGDVTAWDANVDGTVFAIGLSGQNVYVGGHFTTVKGGQTRHNFAAFDVTGSGGTGTLLAAPATTVGGDVWTIAVSGSKVGVGGLFRSAGTGNGANPAPVPRSNAAAIDLTTGQPTSWNPNVNATVQVLAVSGSTVYAGGDFTTVNGGTPRNRLAAFDASTGTASSWDPNANGSVLAITVLDATVYFGGTFTTVRNNVARNRAAAFPAADGTTPTSWDPNANGGVFALASSGSTVYIGGSFTSIRGVPHNRLAAVAAGGVGLPTEWAPSVNGPVLTLAQVGSTVYAGGSFTTVNGHSRPGVAALDGTGAPTTWSPQVALGPGQAGEVYSLAASASTMYVGGVFRTVNGVASPSLAAVSLATGASLETWAPAADDAVNWIALAPQGLAAAGAFTALGHPPPGSAVFDEPDTTPRGGFALVPALPDAPVGVSAVAADSSASVGFSPPAFDGGSPIVTYTVAASPGGATATGAGSPIVVTGLTNGTPYTFTVTATTAAGTGASSAPSAAVTPRAVPGAPTGVSAVPGDGQASVSFAPPSSDGGAAIASYTVTSSPGGHTATGAGSPLVVTGLANGESYTFTVTAHNAVGDGAPSAASNAVVPAPPAVAPGTPTDVTARPGDGRASVSFTAPSSDGGAAIASYTVTASPGGRTATGSSGPITVTGLSNGTSYTFTVTATNGAGTGPASTPSAAVVPAETGRPPLEPPAESPRPTVPAFAAATGPRPPAPH